jgi:hypothetical protein
MFCLRGDGTMNDSLNLNLRNWKRQFYITYNVHSKDGFLRLDQRQKGRKKENLLGQHLELILHVARSRD